MPLKFISRNVFACLIFFFLVFIACDNNRIKYEALEGKWSILDAKRNGRTTPTLENVFFTFESDQSMRTNLLGKESRFSIEYDYPKITTTSSQLNELDVISLRGDTLLIRSRIGEFKYDFELLRSE